MPITALPASRLQFEQLEIVDGLLVNMSLWPDLGVASWLVRPSGVAVSVTPGVTLVPQIANPHDVTTLWTDGFNLFFGATPVGGGGAGTVVSVGLAMPSIFSVSGSPVTSSGTLTATLNDQAQNLFFAGPTTGSATTPAFRSIVPLDIGVGASAGRMLVTQTSSAMSWTAMSGDVTMNGSGVTTLASVISAGGPVGSTNTTPVITYDAKGRLTAVSTATITPVAIGAAYAGPVTTSNLTMITNKLLGRTTAGTGAIEQISIGAGLSFSAGTLAVTSTGGTVTSVGLALPDIFSVSGSPVTVSGTLTGTLVTQAANTFWGGPTVGSPATPAFRGIEPLDLAVSPTSAQMLLSQTPTTMAWKPMSGDATIALTGVVTLSSTILAAGPIGAANTVPVITYDAKGRLTTVTTAIITPAAIGAAHNGAVTASGLTMSAARLLGRSTAGTGSIEEISIGTGLLLSGGVLTNVGPGSGTVTSVGLSLPSIFTVTVSPITTSGTLTAVLANESQNLIFAGPTVGAATAPTFRALVPLDISGSPVAGDLLIVQSGTTMAWEALSGDATIDTAGVLTLSNVIAAAGPIGAPDTVPVITFDSKGRLTTVTTATITPAAIGAVPVGPVTTSGLTMSTSTLLGRTTAATGAIEEITAGAGLTLSGGVLDTVNNGTITGSGTATQLAIWDGSSSITGDNGLTYNSGTDTLTTGTYLADVGAAGSPAFAFGVNTNTGLYQAATDILGFSAGGVSIMTASATVVTVNGKLTVTGLIDPTGLQLTQVAANPGTADTLWIDSGDASWTVQRRFYFNASTTAGSSINLPHGVAPTSPVDGDAWTTTVGLFLRINGATVGPMIDGSVLNASNLTVGTMPASAEPAHTGDVTNIAGSLALTISTGAVTDTKASLANKPASTVVATSNQTLSGIPTIDGQLLADGSIVLNTAQTAPAENGPWVVHAGSWTRPTWYPSGGTTQAFQFITTLIRLGTTYRGSTWRMTTAGAITIDTTGTTWVVTPFALNSNTVTGTLPVAQFPANTLISTAGVTVDGSGTTLTTGSKGFVQVQYTGTITNWTVLAAGAGSIVVDVKRTTTITSPGSGASMVGAGNKPTLTSAQGATAAVSGWTSTAVTAGDVIEWNVDSVTSITRVTVELQITRT